MSCAVQLFWPSLCYWGTCWKLRWWWVLHSIYQITQTTYFSWFNPMPLKALGSTHLFFPYRKGSNSTNSTYTHFFLDHTKKTFWSFTFVEIFSISTIYPAFRWTHTQGLQSNDAVSTKISLFAFSKNNSAQWKISSVCSGRGTQYLVMTRVSYLNNDV